MHGFRAIAQAQNQGDIATLARYKHDCRVVNAREIGRTLIHINLHCVAPGRGNRAARRRAALKSKPARFIPTPPADTFAEVKTEARTPRPFRTNHHD